jgi:M-phase inducer phosphatase 2
MREIRKLDRMLNKNSYPALTYPELYLLEGGYKHFFETNNQYCLPKSYKPMLHDEHRNDLKYFRKKSKSWEVETRKRLVKSRLDFI